jgi:hypothetical protein
MDLEDIATLANGATVALLLAALFLPDYGHLLTATLIALPWVAVWLVARFQPLYRFSAKRDDEHPSLIVLLILPAFGLVARALADVDTFDWPGPTIMALTGGLTLGGTAIRVDPWLRRQRGATVLVCIVTLAYGLGAGLEIDVLADPSKASIYPTRVLGKRVYEGTKWSTYSLTVGPWGPISQADEIFVSAARYRLVRTGDTVCVYVGKGALVVPWYQVRGCPNNN